MSWLTQVERPFIAALTLMKQFMLMSLHFAAMNQREFIHIKPFLC